MKLRNTTAVIAVLAMMLTAGIASAGDYEDGVAAFKKADWATAIAKFKAQVDKQPEWAGGHFMLGWAYLKNKNTRDAITHLRKAYDLEPANANHQMRLGEAYVAANRNSDAVAFLSKIDASALPKNAQGYLAQLKAVALTKSGQAGSAVAELKKSAAANPNDADIQFQLGSTAAAAGDTRTALSALAKAASLDPGDSKKQLAYAKVLIGQAVRMPKGSAKDGQYRKAAAAAQRVVSSNASFDNLMLLGDAELGSKSYDAAIATYKRASAKNSADWLPEYYIGQAYTAKGQYRSAESSLKTSLDRAKTAADQAKVWKQLGFVYEKQRNFTEAISSYNRAGDGAGAERARKNQETQAENRRIEAENTELAKLKAEQEALEAELKNLPGAAPPRF
ncbi:MAG: tetratricopeptide repeat protein [Thermoanaerobaculia bacterium]